MLHSYAFRITRARHGHHVRPRHALDLLEHLVVDSPVGHIRGRDRSAIARKSRVAIREGYQPILVWIRKGTQQQCIDGAENRCRAADSEGQRENGYQRKGGRFAQPPSRVAKVLPQSFDPTRDGPGADHAKA